MEDNDQTRNSHALIVFNKNSALNYLTFEITWWRNQQDDSYAFEIPGDIDGKHLPYRVEVQRNDVSAVIVGPKDIIAVFLPLVRSMK